LPKHSVQDAVRQVFATGRPVITNAFKGVFTGRLMVSVHVPVFRDGRVVYDLAMNVPTDRFAKVLLLERLPPEWIGTIFDSNQVIVARTRLADELVGWQARPVLGQRLRSTAEGTAEFINFENVPMFSSFTRSATSDWTVMIGVPKANMVAEIWRWLGWALAATAVLSSTGIMLALLMARRIAGSIQGLIAPALALGRGEPVAIKHLELKEFDEAVDSLVMASQLIQQRAEERERAEAAHRESEELRRLNAELERSEAEARARAAELAAIMDAVPAITFIARDPEARRVTCNHAGYDLLRLPSGTNTSLSTAEANRRLGFRLFRDGSELSPEDLPLRRAVSTAREVRDCECTIVFDDGSSRSIYGNSVPLLDETGKVWGAVSAYIDITERKRAQAQLEAAAERLRAILTNAPIGINIVDREERVLETNPALCHFLGYSQKELIGRRFTEYTHPDDVERNMELHRGLDSGEQQSYVLEKRFIRKDGSVVWARVGASKINDELRVSTIADINERIRAEQALAESEERLRTIVELAPDGIFVVGGQGQIVEVNQAACKQLKYTREQLLRLKMFDIIAPRFAERAAARLQGKLPPGTYESAQIRADGVEIPVELSVTQIVFRQQPALIRITRDISDRKHAEEQRGILEQQLRQAQKMEAVGQLAGGIAHDFNNLLMVIQSYAEMLQDNLPAQDRLRRNTQEILKAAERAAGLTRQMLAFSRKQILSPVVLDLNAVVDDAAKMLKRLIGENIEFRVSPANSLWAIEADSDQIVQVLMNLCVNARDAMPQGGALTITTGNVTVGGDGPARHPYVAAGEYVMLSVTDTGTGIANDVQRRIFDPFFTTKEVGKGTGLGLSTVYGIVKQSDGFVWVDSELGRGACFTIYLPRAKRAVVPDIPPTPEARPRGAGTILVTEDEEALREAVCGYLRELGYTVFAASSGQEALSLAGEHERHIDLLITDLVMPRLSGGELSQMLGSLRPELKTIYMSGYADDVRLPEGTHEANTFFLQKPFSLSALARKVRDTLKQTEAVQ
jgi:PAS domain S-box-containing protein